MNAGLLLVAGIVLLATSFAIPGTPGLIVAGVAGVPLGLGALGMMGWL